MSTRWYPLYQRGNPQLRVFLPNFWMKLVKLDKFETAGNKIQFIVSKEMSKYDVKNYLEKIYNVPVVDVKTVNLIGKQYINRFTQKLAKEDDYKVAFVTLPPGENFEFPDLKIREKEDEKYEDSHEDVDKAKEEFKKSVKIDEEKFRPGVPTFFGL